jgi:predicted ATP-dependent endonuclease of OLD family
MQLLRVQIPEFRVLKNVDIQFRKELTPKIFPIGSENGGGKSTLLQLIFVLLHCSFNPKTTGFVKNLLNDFKIAQQDGTLAKFEVWDGKDTYQVEFLCYNAASFPKIDFQDVNFAEFKTIQQMDNAICYLAEMKEIEKEIAVLKDRQDSIKSSLSSLGRFSSEHDNFTKQSETVAQQLLPPTHKKDELQVVQAKILRELENQNLIYITTYGSDRQNPEILLCRVHNLNLAEAKTFLGMLSQKIFLAIPSTQICLFLPVEARKSLFNQKIEQQYTYQQSLSEAHLQLSHFFTYSYAAVHILLALLEQANAKDFQQAIKTRGTYGSSYAQLLKELEETLTSGKEIRPNQDRTEIAFLRKGSDSSFAPEDLSHGELRRLSIYAWLRYNTIADAIVLFDEIEIGLHPDWQYRIVHDLLEWGPNNQYILATHSYALCEAVTPAHVNELEPRLLRQGAEHGAQ